MASLENKVILITGSSDGIGAEIAVHLAPYKPRLVLTGRNDERLKQVKESCIQTGLPSNQILTVTADVKIEDDLKKLVDETINNFKQLDVLVNNAGFAIMGTTQTAAIKDYDEMMSVNLRAPFILSQLAIPHLTKTQGNIVNISSIGAHEAFSPSTAYCMSKAGLNHFTRCLAAELGPDKVRVNSISPCYIRTNMAVKAGVQQEEIDQFIKIYADTTCLGRVGEVQDVAKVVKFLASDEAAYITGEDILVDGGRNIFVPSN